jgi:hypothetical protein
MSTQRKESQAYCLGCWSMRPYNLHTWNVVWVEGQEEAVCPECQVDGIKPRPQESASPIPLVTPEE